MATAAQRNAATSIEFVVKPTEDLFLEGALRKLPRVAKGENYPCQMQKNQQFSCLFRHYAKHNGLRKEDLVFTFVDELLPDQTPETVHLMPQDEIYVAHRKSTPDNSKLYEKIPQEKVYPDHFRGLLNSGLHSDITFKIDSDPTVTIKAHRAILSARSDYFNAMLQPGGMYESNASEVVIHHEDSRSFQRLLEFIYTDTIADLENCTANDVLLLLDTANQYLMEDLRILVEPRAAKLITLSNVAKLLLLSANKDYSLLREACIAFIIEHREELTADPTFYSEVERSPELGVLLFQYTFTGVPPNGNGSVYTIADDMNCNNSSSAMAALQRKRRRCTELPEGELDLVPPQLHNGNNSSSNNNNNNGGSQGSNTTTTTTITAGGGNTMVPSTNTIAQNNNSLPDV